MVRSIREKVMCARSKQMHRKRDVKTAVKEIIYDWKVRVRSIQSQHMHV
jgi:hypothetical protein